MALTTCNVLCTIHDDAGLPVEGATVTAKLDRYEVYQGYIVPQVTEAITDANGQVTLALWPNQLGAVESSYAIKIVSPNGKTLRTTVTVPNVSDANLHEIANLPAYDGKSDGQLIIDAAVAAVAPAVAAKVAAEAAAGNASTSASAAASSASQAASSASAASGSATSASNSANSAGSSATTATAQASAAANSATTASTKAGEASDSATTATTQAGIATTKASEASASATTATTKAGEAATSARTATTRAEEAAAAAATATTQAGIATTKAGEAAASASTASTKASEAATSATNAGNSATSATNSASTASTQAGVATTQAGNAAASASQAAASADAADADATNAAISADTASAEAAIATTQAGIATTQAGIATTKASEASASATSANTAATSSMSIYGSMSAVNTAVASATTSANTATTKATEAANSATQAAASAAGAAAIVTGVASNRPSIRPSLLLDFANSKVLDPRITFSRASTATYYDGKTTVKAEENLLLRSQEFDVITAWSLGGASISANSVVAPDGTLTADTFLGDGSSQQHRCYQGFTPISGLPYVFSVYAKAGTNSFLQLLIPFSVNHYANFDLSSGVLGTVGSAATASIVGVGNGWYRCSITLTSTFSTATNTLICLVDSATAGYFQANTLATSVYIWGAQLEQRSTVTAYTPTTTAPIINRIPALQTAAANVARFDHNPVTGESKGLLIEEQRTNLLTYSEFQNGVNTAGGVLQGTMIGPTGGTVNAAVFTSGSAQMYLLPTSSPTLAASTTYAVSVFVRMDDDGVPVFNGAGITTASTNDFVLVVGNSAVLPQNTTVQHVGNGLYRVSGFVTTGTTKLGNNNIFRYSSNSGRGFKVTGWQIEAGAFPTSYIPTTSAQVTRSADAASMTGTNFSSWYRQDEGTLLTSGFNENSAATTKAFSSLNDGTTANRILSYIATSTPAGLVTASSTNVAPFAGSAVTTGALVTQALAFKTDDFAYSANGGAVVTDTYGVLPVVNRLDIGQYTTAALNGTIKRIAYYPKRLSNTELQALTA